MQQYIYIIISRTPTKFGHIIRKLGKQQYNHASIALDEDLSHIYAFARKKHNEPLVGGLQRESLDRFTLRSDINIPVVVFKIPVTNEQYCFISELIKLMLNNNQYNLLIILVRMEQNLLGILIYHDIKAY